MEISKTENKLAWLDRPLFPNLPSVTIEIVLFFFLIILTTVSRLYNLGTRVMSHDESLHAYYSWLFSIGQGYFHNPTTHGPLQFHLIALTYILFGDSDFTARLPHAVASIGTVILLWKWRKYLGRSGTLVASGLVLISPYMLYYGRYARNEAFVAFLGLLTLYAILRYLELGKNRYLLLFTLVFALHFTVKETAFIYSAQALLFLVLYLIVRLARYSWTKSEIKHVWIISLATGCLLLIGSIVLTFLNNANSSTIYLPLVATLFSLAGVAFAVSIILIIVGYGWKLLLAENAFSLLIILGTLVLPQLAAIFVKLLGWDPLDYQFTWPGWNFHSLWSQGPVRTGVVLLILIIISIVVGIFWDWKRWIINAAIFWGIYIFFYTSIFTNWAGLATGVVGSLGYWLVQQGVQRGNQPWYYYLLIQIPIYEYLPFLGLVVASYFGFRGKKPVSPLINSLNRSDTSPTALSTLAPTFYLLYFWTLSSFLIFSIAGEKMPWLTVHIIFPMILLAGWGVGQIVERLDISIFKVKGILATILISVLIISSIGILISLLGIHSPFQGKSVDQLSYTYSFFLLLAVASASAFGLINITRPWHKRDFFRLSFLVLFFLLGIQTTRTAIRAAYITPNDATEYLVYAHGATGIKDILAQIESISNRIFGGNTLALAYDSSSPDSGVAWPFTWYLRHFPNKTSFDQPGGDLRGVPMILVDQKNIDPVNTIIGNDYYRINYIRMVWPNQDYFNLNSTRVQGALLDPLMRSALWEIWFNRDYSLYAKATGSVGMDEPDWIPGNKMALYIRKDLAAKSWGYGIIQNAPIQTDPYEKGKINVQADMSIGASGSVDGQFNSPHGIAIASDGSIFVADTNNNRIQHFTADGKFITSWGTFADLTTGNAPLGTFNQPWDLAISPDGRFIYVADTWNHRIQKFSTDGTPLKMWGKSLYDPTNTDPYGIWGPRGIAVDSRGRVFVADTGNKRILIYDPDGNFISQIGNEGLAVGQFEEPVGLAISKQGDLFVADTWNQRVQVFSPNQDGTSYSPSQQWNISGWYGESLDNKPYVALDNLGNIFITDPEMFRIMEFSVTGTFIRSWGDYGVSSGSFNLPSSIAIDTSDHVWVSDSANNRLLRFTLP